MDYLPDVEISYIKKKATLATTGLYRYYSWVNLYFHTLKKNIYTKQLFKTRIKTLLRKSFHPN